MLSARHMEDLRKSKWLPGIALVVLLACLFGAIASAYVARYQIPFHSAIGIYCGFVLMLMLVVAPGVHGLRQAMENAVVSRRRAGMMILFWCAPYLVYALGTGDFRWSAMARLVIISGFPLATYSVFRVIDLDRFHWQDLLVAVWLIAVVLGRQLNGIWNVPANLDFLGRLFLVAVGAWCWVFVRKVPELGYEFAFSVNTFQAAGANFARFAILALPLGLLLRFTAWNPHWQFIGFVVAFLEIFLFIALLEELFFRGFLQTLLSKSLGAPWRGQLIISCLFGLFHILHAPFPNWRYVLLAAVAGWFYGTAFIRGGNLMASALAHAMVDTVWRNFFTRA